MQVMQDENNHWNRAIFYAAPPEGVENPSHDRPSLLRIGPDAWQLTFAKELDMDHIGVATDRAVFAILLIVAARWVQRNDNLLAAGGADVRPFISRPTTFFPALFHGVTELGMTSRASTR